MILLLWLLLTVLTSPFKSKCQLYVENVALRHQVAVLWRQVRGRIRHTSLNRLVLVQLYRWALAQHDYQVPASFAPMDRESLLNCLMSKDPNRLTSLLTRIASLLPE